ncbi:pseudouridine synthase [Dichelobacter nodosus]|uniref:pseudouridine synthase n=1 Tax=Dichelobacter nodosus TaxID=870 RepID=UPI00107EA776|nr:pseudouridine synthase [Dichelobacter nodosus]TGA65023.1 rRNA pseudouridine synthase [Dichelobacter nodosus]
MNKKNDDAQRIQKYLAARGVGSRRQIETWIKEGRLKVDGRVAELGQKISGNERLSLDGKPLRIAVEHKNPRMILMYHKPAGEICTRKDPEGRVSVFQHLPKISHGRWVAIGRLDLNTSGLLLFTNDGALANQLMHPSAEIEREYWVRVAGEVTEEMLTALRQGIPLDDGLARFTEICPLKTLHEDDTQFNRYFSVTLKEGRNREVRRLWEAVGCKVSRLKRIRYGTISLPPSLSAGRHRLLTAGEQASLISLVSEKNRRDNSPKPR